MDDKKGIEKVIIFIDTETISEAELLEDDAYKKDEKEEKN